MVQSRKTRASHYWDLCNRLLDRSFYVAYFYHGYQGAAERFRLAHFLAALLGVGLGTTLRKFPNRWDNV